MFWRYLKSSFAFWFGLIWAVVGTPFFVIGMTMGLSRVRLSEYGVTTQARVVEKWTSRDSRGNPEHNLRLVYLDRGGVEREHVEEVEWVAFQELEEGESVELLYDPGRPSRARLANQQDKDWWLPLLLGGLGVIFGGVGWGLVVFSISRVRKRLALLRGGFPVTGEVLEVLQDLSVRINNRHPMYLRYTFSGPDGMRREGDSPHLSRKLEQRFQPGDRIAVVYDPSDFDRHEADIYGVRSAELAAGPVEPS